MNRRVIIEIPGKPFAQPRPKARVITKGKKSFALLYDPHTAKKWKEYAKDYMDNGQVEYPLEGPIRLRVFAVWPLAKSNHSKTNPVPRSFFVSPRDDYDNVLKAIGDAGNGIVWADDGQIVDARIQTIRGSQYEEGRLQIIVDELSDDDIPSDDLFQREL